MCVAFPLCVPFPPSREPVRLPFLFSAMKKVPATGTPRSYSAAKSTRSKPDLSLASKLPDNLKSFGWENRNKRYLCGPEPAGGAGARYLTAGASEAKRATDLALLEEFEAETMPGCMK